MFLDSPLVWGYQTMEVRVLTASSESVDVANAFATLAQITREWRELDRITTSAGLKPAFIDAMHGTTEKNFGFETWREFVEAAAKAGHVVVKPLTTGHVAVLLPGETVDVLPSSARERSGGTAGETAGRAEIAAGHVRLKPDVWAIFLEWQDNHRRLWDTGTSRAFMYPVNEDGSPAWESEPDRFSAIEPISMEAQQNWMREWVSTLPPEDREPLSMALANDAPLGSFLQKINARGLTVSWRKELQRRVVLHVREWADTHGIPWHALIDNRFQERAPRAAARNASKYSNTSERRTNTSVIGDTGISQLREMVHRMVDRMSLTELAALPIRAEHLLDGR